jgi:hypothetical protein
MRESLTCDLDSLDALLPHLEKRRSFSPLANDIFEACDYWSKLGHRALQNDTRVNYPARSDGEMPLLEKLQSMLNQQAMHQSFSDALSKGRAILSALQSVTLSKEGHMGTLRAIRREFAFASEFGFRIMREEPTGIFFSSGTVYVNLEWATTPDLSCEFGPEGTPKKRFGVDDLLYMVHDSRYRTIPRELNLDTEAKVEEWFIFLAGVFKRYGRDVLANRPGVFGELEQAQLQRDREYGQEMDARYGSHLK